ncbi:MAG: deoxyribodipyrimidine photolyase [Clostridia bacterium]|nr:deoxyribodipyrimidine photolyase [Deltaproteobacteria bacterium]
MATNQTSASSREERARALHATLPWLGESQTISPIVGGLEEASSRVARLDTTDYAAHRNNVDGPVTRLSPYIRHGILSLVAVRDVVSSIADENDRYRLMQQLAWRDYFRRVQAAIGPQIWDDLESYKTGYGSDHYAVALPRDIVEASTGIDYVDTFVRELYATGWLHNHARMWLASYVCHARAIRWQTGARWFLRHLLDGDEASNNLSWQWVASTFSQKPYIFNRDNVVRFSGDKFPRHAASDPLDVSYETLKARFFRETKSEVQTFANALREVQESIFRVVPNAGKSAKKVAWVHVDALRSAHPAYAAHLPIFVWDPALLEDWSVKRALFVDETLDNFPTLTRRHGDCVREVLDFARANGASRVVVPATSNSQVNAHIARLRESIAVDCVADAPFVTLEGPVDLRRFSRYWPRVEEALGLTRGGSRGSAPH